jgi:uncharacterized protein YunC (DUF1805 family)
MKRPNNTLRILLKLFYVVLVLAGLGVSIFYYTKYSKVTKDYNKLKNTPVADLIKMRQASDTDQLIAEVGALYDLPKNETPVIYEVTDKTSLKDPFFASAENGDKALLYQNSKKAILFRPSTKKLINVSALNVTTAKTVVDIAGKAADVTSVEKILKDAHANDVTVGNKADAKGTYITPVIVDLTGKNAELVKKLAAELKGTVGDLPTTEDKPANADILVLAAPIL